MAEPPAAIMASLVDVRNLDTHKCVKLTIHVPAEQAGIVLDAFGWPTMVNPVPVAIARMDTGATIIIPPAKGKREFHTLPFTQQACIKSNDLKFQLWLSSNTDVGKECESAAEAIKAWCGVTSRKDIINGEQSGDRWLELLRIYDETGLR